jgi:hypothetical protein
MLIDEFLSLMYVISGHLVDGFLSFRPYFACDRVDTVVNR